MSKHFVLQLASTSTTTIYDVSNEVIRNVKLLYTYLKTNSSTNKIYFIDFPQLDMRFRNNLTHNDMIPIPIGYTHTDMNLASIWHSFPHILEYRVYDTTGTITSDTVNITLVLQYE